MIGLSTDQRDRFAQECPQRTEYRTERDRPALEAAWRADPAERPPPEA